MKPLTISIWALGVANDRSPRVRPSLRRTIVHQTKCRLFSFEKFVTFGSHLGYLVCRTIIRREPARILAISPALANSSPTFFLANSASVCRIFPKRSSNSWRIRTQFIANGRTFHQNVFISAAGFKILANDRRLTNDHSQRTPPP